MGILLSIAVPSYTNYVIRAGRVDGMTTMQEIMRAQENFFANEFTYTSDLSELNYSNTQLSSSGKYKITAKECALRPLTECVELTATAIEEQMKDGNLTLDSRGNRTHDGNIGWPK